MMNLSDRAKAITAEDLIRRYDLDGLKKYKKAISTIGEGLTRTNANLENYVEAVTKDIKELQNQVDGNISVWSFNGVPSPSSPPANEWINEEEKNNHLGDLYYDQETGYAYRWVNIDNAYQWEEIKDKEVVEALAIANAAKDMADSKRRIFVPREIDGVLVEEPTTPYDAGDIWLYRGELYRCIRSREEGEWNTADWVDDMIYTDDTTANQAITDLGNFKEEVQVTYVPNKVFTETNNSINSTIQSVQVAVSKKNTIFKEQPKPPYIVGDVYIQNEKIYVCKTARAEGDYSSEDWELDLDTTQYATKTQIEQTDERITLVAESVSSKVDEKDLISKINVSPEAIELTSNRFSLESDNLDIAHDGSIKITSSEENTKFLVTNADETSKVKIVDKGIVMTDDRSQLNVDIGGPAYIGAFNIAQAEIRAETLEATVTAQIYGDDASITILDASGDAVIAPDQLEFNGVDVLNRFSNGDINTKTKVGLNSSEVMYLRGEISDGTQYQCRQTPHYIQYQKYSNGNWSTLWGISGHVGEFLIASLNADFKITTASTYTTIPLTQQAYKVGTSLSLSNNGIKIGAGVSAVRIKAQYYFYTGTKGGKSLQIIKNSSVVVRTSRPATEQYTTIDCHSVINVTEGDIISIQASCAANDLIKDYDHSTHLIVEVIR